MIEGLGHSSFHTTDTINCCMDCAYTPSNLWDCCVVYVFGIVEVYERVHEYHHSAGWEGWTGGSR